MAAARDTTVANIKPASMDTLVFRFTAGAAIEPGELVCMQADGYIDPAIGTSVAAAQILGVALTPRNQGTAYAAGDVVDVAILGPVTCMTGATVGAIIYVSDTAGELSETAGTKAAIAGIAQSATVLFVRPQTSALS
jgi:hypothetical protein